MIGRLLSALLTVWLAATVTFVMLRILPGDAIQAQIALGGGEQAVAEERSNQLGLNDPFWVQYGRFIGALLRGDLGVSLLDGQSVNQKIQQRLRPTLELAAGALIVATGLGFCLGIWGAIRLPFGLSAFARTVSGLSLSLPVYWTGTLAIYVFTVLLGLLPSGGGSRLSQLIMPVAVLGFAASGAIAQVVQTNVRDTLNSPFVAVARSKGLAERRVLLVHVLRVVLIPIIAVIAVQAGLLISGAVVTEYIFARPGLGRLILEATNERDYPVVQGLVIFSTIAYVLVNLVADALYILVDPRISTEP